MNKRIMDNSINNTYGTYDDIDSHNDVSVYQNIKIYLDNDKIESSREYIQSYINSLIHDTNISPPTISLLSILSDMMDILSTDEDDTLEERATRLLLDMKDIDIQNTKTYKRVSGLVAILKEANERISKVQKKIDSSNKKHKLPDDYYNPSCQTLRMNILISIAHKRMDVDECTNELASISDYSRKGLFTMYGRRIGTMR